MSTTFCEVRFARERGDERATGIEADFSISQIRAIRRKLAAISTLTASSGNAAFARFAQNYAVRVSEFVRKPIRRFYGSSFCSRSHDAVVRVYDEAGNVIKTHEHVGDFKEPQPALFRSIKKAV